MGWEARVSPALGIGRVHGRTDMKISAEMDQPLGLAGSDTGVPSDRRRVPRYDAIGSAVVDFGDLSLGHRLSGVELVDSSASGIGVMSDVPAEIGSMARVFFDGSPLPCRVGRVARCEPVPDDATGEMRYRIGLDSGLALAA